VYGVIVYVTANNPNERFAEAGDLSNAQRWAADPMTSEV
jgi:hypothetical protein